MKKEEKKEEEKEEKEEEGDVEEEGEVEEDREDEEQQSRTASPELNLNLTFFGFYASRDFCLRSTKRFSFINERINMAPPSR